MAPRQASIETVNWWGYVERVSRHAPRVQIARLVGLTPSAVSRWASGALPDPDKAAALARAYDRPVLEAFIAAGWITPEEADVKPSDAPSLDSYDDSALLDELQRRAEFRRRVLSDLQDQAMTSDFRAWLEYALTLAPAVQVGIAREFERMAQEGDERGGALQQKTSPADGEVPAEPEPSADTQPLPVSDVAGNDSTTGGASSGTAGRTLRQGRKSVGRTGAARVERGQDRNAARQEEDR